MTATQTKSRPILFIGPMVRALLDGTKTQTRRVLKFQPPSVEAVREMSGSGFSIFTDHHQPEWFRCGGPVWAVRKLMGVTPNWTCPYGRPGDRLWVRETWRPFELDDGQDGVKFQADDAFKPLTITDDYFADNMEAVLDKWVEINDRYRGQWRPSIFMPRWASRLTLEVEQVRVERVQEISEADAVAEGVAESWTETWWQGYREFNDDLMHQQATGDEPPDWMIEPKKMKMDHMRRSAVQNYRSLWDSINGKSHPWESNPWVWVVTFKVVSDSVSAGTK